MKTVRFAEVVKRCGQPESYVLWTSPGRDPEFKRAVEKNRVMTVHQENRGGKKDYGIVGFTKDPHAELLVFPKSLQRFAGTRTVGIHYDLLKEPAEKKGSRKEKGKRNADSFAVYEPPAPPPPKDEPEEEEPEAPEEPSTKEDSEPISESPPPKRATPKASKPAKPQTESSLVREVRRALTELKQGKAVAAYQRLEKALQKTKQH